MSFLRTLAPRTTLVFHQPLSGVDSYRAKSMTLVRRLSRVLGLPVRSFDCDGGCHGTLTDWHNRHLPGRAVTMCSAPGCRPPRSPGTAAACSGWPPPDRAVRSASR